EREQVQLQADEPLPRTGRLPHRRSHRAARSRRYRLAAAEQLGFERAGERDRFEGAGGFARRADPGPQCRYDAVTPVWRPARPTSAAGPSVATPGAAAAGGE